MRKRKFWTLCTFDIAVHTHSHVDNVIFFFISYAVRLIYFLDAVLHSILLWMHGHEKSLTMSDILHFPTINWGAENLNIVGGGSVRDFMFRHSFSRGSHDISQRMSTGQMEKAETSIWSQFHPLPGFSSLQWSREYSRLQFSHPLSTVLA